MRLSEQLRGHLGAGLPAPVLTGAYVSALLDCHSETERSAGRNLKSLSLNSDRSVPTNRLSSEEPAPYPDTGLESRPPPPLGKGWGRLSLLQCKPLLTGEGKFLDSGLRRNGEKQRRAANDSTRRCSTVRCPRRSSVRLSGYWRGRKQDRGEREAFRNSSGRRCR